MVDGACVVCGKIGMITKDCIVMIIRPLTLCGDCSRKYNASPTELTKDELGLILKQQTGIRTFEVTA